MDLVLSLTIEKIDMKANNMAVHTHDEDWLKNANLDLLNMFNQSDADEKMEDIKKTNEIKVDRLDLCYDAGQYYVMDEETHHLINDQDKIHLPGYVVTAHIRNNSQVNALSVDPRYSEDLIDFEQLMIEPNSIHAPTLHNYFSEDADVKQNALEHFIDLPQMVFENRQDRQQINRDRDEFHPPIAVNSRNREEHNILNTLGIDEKSDGFFNYAASPRGELFAEESENIHVLDEMYQDTRRSQNDGTEENKVEQKKDVKNNIRNRFNYLKKAIIGS